jgi:POT family proton-dependent oligopeptide transporter
MAFGAAVVAASYVLLAGIASWTQAHGTQAHWAWLVGWFVLMTLGELYILPVGLGLFGHLAPEGLRATCIALWFFAGFFGNLLAGAVGTLWSRLPHGGFFLVVGAVAGGSAALLWLVGVRVERAQRRDNPPSHVVLSS